MYISKFKAVLLSVMLVGYGSLCVGASTSSDNIEKYLQLKKEDQYVQEYINIINNPQSINFLLTIKNDKLRASLQKLNHPYFELLNQPSVKAYLELLKDPAVVRYIEDNEI